MYLKTSFFCTLQKHFFGSTCFPFNRVPLILHQIRLDPPYGREEPWMKGWLSWDLSPTGESDTVTHKHTTICDQCLWAIATPRAAGMLNGDRADVVRAESDGDRQTVMRDAVSSLLHPVSSRSVSWLTTSDVLPKYYYRNYNTSNIHITVCGLVERGIYLLIYWMEIIAEWWVFSKEKNFKVKECKLYHQWQLLSILDADIVLIVGSLSQCHDLLFKMLYWVV